MSVVPSRSTHNTGGMQPGCELRETIQVFIILMVSKIRLRPSRAAELGALGRRLLRSVSNGDNTNLRDKRSMAGVNLCFRGRSSPGAVGFV